MKYAQPDERLESGPIGSVGRPTVGYLMSRFPKLSETFVLYEILALEQAGVSVEVFPLLRHREKMVHPDARPVMERAHYLPFISPAILLAQLHFLARKPLVYLRTLWDVFRGTLPSRNFLIGAIGIFPKTVRFALEMEAAGVSHVHAHFATHPALAAFIIHRLTGIPYSFTAHGSDLHVDRTMLRAKLKEARFSVAICEFNRQMMIVESGPETSPRIEVVHCGVDTSLFKSEAVARPEGGPITVACVASLEPIKGHRHLLSALAVVRDRGVEMRCELVGDGPLKKEVAEDIRRLGLESTVRMLGAQPREAVLEILGRSHVFALTSYPTPRGQREGIPVAIMEAMSLNLPVITTRTGGIPELVADGVTGVVVEPGDVEAIAEALCQLATDGELRRTMGDAGRLKVEREFDQRTNARRLAGLFVFENQRSPRAADGPPMTLPAASWSSTARLS